MTPESALAMRPRATAPRPDRTPPHTIAPRDLQAFAYAAAAQLLCDERSDSAQLEWLRERLAAVALEGRAWHHQLGTYLRNPAPADAGLLRLMRDLGLSLAEVLAVALAAAVEVEPMAGRALAALQSPLGGARPTLGLVARLFADLPGDAGALEQIACGVAQRSGLLVLHGDGPLHERALAVPPATALALRGIAAEWAGVATEVGRLPPLAPSIAAEAERQARALARPGAVAIHAGSFSEGRAAACAVAAALGRRAAFVETEHVAGIGPWLLLRELVPVFVLAVAPGEQRELPALPAYAGPVLALCPPEASVCARGEPLPGWRIGAPPRAERELLWRDALGDAQLAADLAAQHRHSGARIAQLAQAARLRVALDGRDRACAHDVASAARAGEGLGLGALAQSLPETVGDEALVLPPGAREELELLIARCRARDGLCEGLGPAARARYHPGVRALFVGPSGTGKTLAASWVATRLEMPLFRVDLAAVTSKYIGETEKNLAQLIARAESAEVALLFDEADSLFGKRTDIKDSNDRFANAQTNYLLQRIECFDGIAILTSNSRARFDSAFCRRLDAIVEFPLPAPEERRALWLAHLGAGHNLSTRELNQLATAADVAGGHIRNAVLAAALPARAQGRPIELADIVEGLRAEYRKLGRPAPFGRPG